MDTMQLLRFNGLLPTLPEFTFQEFMICRAFHCAEHNSRVDPQECTWYFVMLDYPTVHNSRAVKLWAQYGRHD